MRAKGLTRPITRKQALSYEVLTPNSLSYRRNGMGVTAIAAVMNGRATPSDYGSTHPGAEFQHRYAMTREMLERPAPQVHQTGGIMLSSRPKKRKYLKNPTAYQYEREARREAAERVKAAQAEAKERIAEAKAADKAAAAEAKAEAQAAKAAGAPAPKKKAAKKKLTKAQQAAAARKRAASIRKRVGKKFGPFKSIGFRAGKRSLPTFAYQTKKGRPAKIPLWAILGTKSKRDLEKRLPESKSLQRRVVAVKARRDRAAARLAKYGDFFTPNYGSDAMMYEENKRKGRKRGKRKSAKRGTARHPRKKLYGAARKAWYKARGLKMPKAARKGSAKRRKASAAPKRRKSYGKRRTPAQRRATSKMIRVRHGIKRVRHRKAWKNARHAMPNMFYNMNPMYEENKVKHRKSRKHRGKRGSYKRNPDFMAQAKSALMSGAVVAVGFLAHRGLSFLVSEQLVKRVDYFDPMKSPKAAPWVRAAAGALVAVAGIPLSAFAGPKFAKELGAGMAVSLISELVRTVIFTQASDSPRLAAAFAGYPDAEGHSFHSMSGVGSYEMMPPGYAGFGGYTQAAAGLGRLGGYTQAAAGIGGVTQAAAGVGEYFATGVSGIGEYEAVNGFGTNEVVREGIRPNLLAAERSLSVAEAVAGLGEAEYSGSGGGVNDAPLESIVDAEQIAAPVLDAPGGSRAGILEGGDGIFASIFS